MGRQEGGFGFCSGGGNLVLQEGGRGGRIQKVTIKSSKKTFYEGKKSPIFF